MGGSRGDSGGGDAGVAEDPWEATLELRSTRPPAGSLVLENRSRTSLRVWRQGNSWGDAALSFDVTADGEVTRITRAALDYTRNVPATVEVPPGERHELPFDLGDGTWELASALTQLDRSGAQLKAVYDSGDAPEAREQGIWRGEVRSGRHALR